MIAQIQRQKCNTKYQICTSQWPVTTLIQYHIFIVHRSQFIQIWIIIHTSHKNISIVHRSQFTQIWIIHTSHKTRNILGHIGLGDYVGLLSRFYEKWDRKRDIPVKNGIPQIRTDKRSTVFDPAPVLIRPIFDPVSIYPVKNENERENTVYGCGQNGIYPVGRHGWPDTQSRGRREWPRRTCQANGLHRRPAGELQGARSYRCRERTMTSPWRKASDAGPLHLAGWANGRRGDLAGSAVTKEAHGGGCWSGWSAKGEKTKSVYLATMCFIHFEHMNFFLP